MVSNTYVCNTYDLNNTMCWQGWMMINGHQRMEGVRERNKANGTWWTDVDGCQMKVNGRTLMDVERKLMDVKWNWDGRWWTVTLTKLWWMTIAMASNGDERWLWRSVTTTTIVGDGNYDNWWRWWMVIVMANDGNRWQLQRSVTTTGDDYNRWQLRRMTTAIDGNYDRRWRCRIICVCKFSNDGVEKKRENFFSSTSYFIFIFFLLLQRILQLVPLIIRAENQQRCK